MRRQMLLLCIRRINNRGVRSVIRKETDVARERVFILVPGGSARIRHPTTPPPDRIVLLFHYKWYFMLARE